MKSLLKLLESTIGFNPENVLTMTVTLPAPKYTDAGKQVSFYDQLNDRVQSLPGVNGAGTVTFSLFRAVTRRAFTSMAILFHTGQEMRPTSA